MFVLMVSIETGTGNLIETRQFLFQNYLEISLCNET